MLLPGRSVGTGLTVGDSCSLRRASTPEPGIEAGIEEGMLRVPPNPGRHPFRREAYAGFPTYGITPIFLRSQHHSCDAWTISPPTIVSSARTSRIRRGSVSSSNRSSLSSTRSAYFPGVMEPRSSSAKHAIAPPSV